METQPLNVSICSQKGGVGKSTLTVFAASWLHYVLGRNVLVVDCDYPQWSIYGQRERELHVLDRSDYYKLMLLRQFRATGRKLWPLLRSTPQEALDAAKEYIRREGYAAEAILYDLPGSVSSEGVLSLLCDMDELFIPVKADKIVAESSIQLARNLRPYAGRPDVRLRGIHLFWNMVDKRERTPLYDRYRDVIARLDLSLMRTQVAYRAKFNRELLPDGTGIGRSTLLSAERSFAREAGIEAFVEEMSHLLKRA